MTVGTALGCVLGLSAGSLLHWAEKNEYIERASYLSYSVALAFATLGAARAIHTDGILAVFAAGIVFTWVVAGSQEIENDFMHEAFNQFFLLPVFVFFGMVAPWEAWRELGPMAWLFVGAILLFRRLPAVFLIRPVVKPLADASSLAFYGWFGPLGVAALFYGIHASNKTGNDYYWHLASLVVLGSIFIHGATAPIFTRWYGDKHNVQK